MLQHLYLTFVWHTFHSDYGSRAIEMVNADKQNHREIGQMEPAITRIWHESHSQKGNIKHKRRDEPTTGLHPADVEKLMAQLNILVDAGNTVIVVEHDMHVIAASDWVIDIGPAAGDEGGKVVAAGTPAIVAKSTKSKTAKYLERYMANSAV